MTIVPTIRQIKINGKPIGNHYIVIDKQKVNLKTKNYLLARERAIESVETGRRDFPEDGQKALPPVSSGNSGGTVPTDWAADLHAAVSGNEGPPPSEAPTPKVEPIRPDKVFPPGELPPIDPPTPQNAPSDAPSPDESTNIPPEMLEELLETAAGLLVQFQLDGQAWLIRKMVKREPAELGATDATRVGAVKIWKKYLQTSFPADVPLPPYLVAPLLIASFGAMEQISKSTPLRNEDNPQRPHVAVVP